MSVAAVPPEELFFAVLNAPVSRGRARLVELGYAFEASLPAELSEFHARYEPLPDGRFLAVGIERTTATDLGAHYHAATPSAWPDWIDQQLPAPASFNLLTGDAEPRVVKAVRSRLVARVAIAVIATSLTVSIGLERRIRSDTDQSALLRSGSREAIRSALGDTAARTSQPLNAVMVSELRRLRATRGDSGNQSGNETGADAALATILSAWPPDSVPKTESIVIAERSIELTILVSDPQEAQKFLSALTEIDGLTLATTTSNQSSDGTRLSVRFDRGVTP